MLSRLTGTVIEWEEWGVQAQIIRVRVNLEDVRPALNYLTLTGAVVVGDQVVLNTTAKKLDLGTGGFDFVIANMSRPTDSGAVGVNEALSRFAEDGVPPDLSEVERHLRLAVNVQALAANHLGNGHIIKGRYLPCQQAVLTLEEQEQYAPIWEKHLDGFPVLVGQLHSQIAPAAAALHLSGKTKIAYIMTDQAALPMAFSRLVRALTTAGLLTATLTCGQAFGGDHETVTLHSALLAAKHIFDSDAAIVCQGPGNAGTGTRYGFSGIEQAQNLDIVKALGGAAIAIVRMSAADTRERHQNISHHTRTTLEMAYARCIVPLPAGTDDSALPPGHDVRFVEGAQAALDLLAEKNIRVTTMGRTPDEDPAFFLAAAAAGMV